MTLTSCVDTKAELLITTGDGVLSNSDLQHYMETISSDPEIRPGFNALIDFRAVTEVRVSIPEIDTDIQTLLDEDGADGTSMAMVASDANAEEISRFCNFLQTRLSGNVQLFGDLSEARAWLGLSPEQGHSRAPRKAVSNKVRIRTGIHELSGQLINISRSGALLKCPTYQPFKGRTLKIEIQRQGASDVDLTGTVVRVTQNTFATQFQSVTDEVAKRIEELA